MTDALAGAIARALTDATGATDATDAGVRADDVTGVTRVSAGANRRTHRAEVEGLGTVVVQVERPGARHGLAADQQAALIRRAAAGGVPVPPVLASGTDQDGPLAGHWTITRHLPGEAIPRVVLRALDEDGRAALLAQVADAAATVHRLEPGALPEVPDLLGQVVALLDATGPPPAAVSLAVRWLQLHRPPPGPHGVVHGDLRLGNVLVDLGEEGGGDRAALAAPGPAAPAAPAASADHAAEVAAPRLTALLDWELAHTGAVHADLGWFCGRAWRFGSPRPAGGLGTRDELLAAYADAGGAAPDRDALGWWELLGCVRWAAMCQIMGGDAARRDPPALEPAMVGRRVAEAAFDCLRLLPGGAESGAPVPGGAGVDEPALPEEPPAERGSGRDLLAAAAAELDRRAEDPDGPRRWQARVAANAVRTAARQWWLAERNRARHQQRLDDLGVADDDELRTRIADGAWDDELADLALVLTATARDALAVVHPTYTGHLHRAATPGTRAAAPRLTRPRTSQ